MIENPKPLSSSAGLRRTLGVGGATMLGLGSMIGGGVFIGLGVAASFAGPSIILATLLAAVLAACNALSSAQLAAAHPVSGGTYEYGYRLLHPAIGFLAGWMFLCAKTASAAAAAIGAASYGLMIAGIDAGFIRSVAAAIAALAMTALVVSGLRRSSAVNIVIVSCVIATLVALIATSFLTADQSSFSRLKPVAPAREDISAFLTATALIFVAYTGYGRIATLGEEAQNPRQTIPRAIAATVIVSTILYSLVGAAGLLAIGADEFAAATQYAATPLETAAKAVGGGALGLALAVGAVAAMSGVLLNLILGLSRVAFAMGRRGDLPKSFGKLSASSEPTTSVLFTGCAVALIASFGAIEIVWTFSALTVLVYYAVTNMAALKLPRASRLYPRWISVLGLVGCLGLILFIPLHIWLLGLAVTAIGFACRELSKKYIRRHRHASDI